MTISKAIDEEEKYLLKLLRKDNLMRGDIQGAFQRLRDAQEEASAGTDAGSGESPLRTAARQAWHYFQSPNSYSEAERNYVFECLDNALQAGDKGTGPL